MVYSYALGRAREAQNAAAEWKAYAEKLKYQLRGALANAEGMRALKEAALTEVAKLDPKNHLMVQPNRQRIYDAAYNAAACGKATDGNR